MKNRNSRSELLHVTMSVEPPMNTELVFLIEEAPEGGYTARALSQAIFTEGDTPEQVEANVRDAVRCHFDEDDLPKVIRLHYVRDDVIAI